MAPKSGGTAPELLDSTRYGNNGTLFGAMGSSRTAGQLGNALNFDGNDDYADMGNGSSLNITDRITISAWIKPSALPSAMGAEYPGFFKQGTRFNFWFWKTGDLANKLSFKWKDGAGANHDNSPLTHSAFGAGKWYHITFTYDGSYARAYVDGNLEGTSAVIFSEAAARLLLGTGGVRGFAGAIDKVHISSIAR